MPITSLPCRVTPRTAVPLRALSELTIPFQVPPCHVFIHANSESALHCLVIPCTATPHLTLSDLTIPRTAPTIQALPCQAKPNQVPPRRSEPCPVELCLTPYRLTGTRLASPRLETPDPTSYRLTIPCQFTPSLALPKTPRPVQGGRAVSQRLLFPALP